MRLVMESRNGSVWLAEEGSRFWIRYGNIRWCMDAECLAPYKGYLQSVHAFLEGEGRLDEPAYIRTKDPALFLALNPAEIGELVTLLDMAETILAVEAGTP